MRASHRINLLFVVLLIAGYAVAQNNTPQYFLAQLPPLPDNFCAGNHDDINRWRDRVLALEDKMKELLSSEKYAKKEYQAAAKPNLAIYEPSNEAILESLKKNMKESEEIREKTNLILNELLIVYREKKIEVTNRHYQILDPLRQQRGEDIAQGKNTSVIDKKIYAGEMEECKELALVQKELLERYRSKLDLLVEYGIRANKLTDETNGVIYTSYSFITKYGFWMEFLLGYIHELGRIFDNIPMKNTDIENI